MPWTIDGPWGDQWHQWGPTPAPSAAVLFAVCPRVPGVKDVAGAVGKAQQACIPVFWHSRQREEVAAGEGSGGSAPSPSWFPWQLPALHALATFWSSSCCLRVIHRPQPLMDSIQLPLPRPPLSVIHVVAGSRFLLAVRVPDILYLRIIFFLGSQFFPSLPFLLSAPSMLRWGRGSGSITHHPLPTCC